MRRKERGQIAVKSTGRVVWRHELHEPCGKHNQPVIGVTHPDNLIEDNLKMVFSVKSSLMLRSDGISLPFAIRRLMVQENRHRGFSRFMYLAIVALLALTVRLAPLSGRVRPGCWHRIQRLTLHGERSEGGLRLRALGTWCLRGARNNAGTRISTVPVSNTVPVFCGSCSGDSQTGTVVVIGVAAAAVAGTLSGIVATSIFAFDVSSIANCVTIMSEPLFTTIVTLAFGLQIVAVFWFADTRKS